MQNHIHALTNYLQRDGFDPEKYCPTCYRKFKRHATRKRTGDHKHYPIFAVCNPTGKNPGNVWEISTKAHYGNEHFAIDKFNIIDILKRFSINTLFVQWFSLVIQLSLTSHISVESITS